MSVANVMKKIKSNPVARANKNRPQVIPNKKKGVVGAFSSCSPATTRCSVVP